MPVESGPGMAATQRLQPIADEASTTVAGPKPVIRCGRFRWGYPRRQGGVYFGSRLSTPIKIHF